MKEIITNGAKLFIRALIIKLMCFFVVISLISFAMSVFSEEIGYVAYGSLENSSEAEELYTYYNDDGEDTKLSEYEEKGYTVTTQALRKIGDTENVFILIVAQAFALGILISFVYPSLWDKGYSDINLVNLNQKKEDKLKGLKIGMVAEAPFIASYLFMLVTANNISSKIPVSIMKFLNADFYPVIDLIIGNRNGFSDLGIMRAVLLLLPLLALPVISFIGYYLGYKGYSIGEKLKYKRTR